MKRVVKPPPIQFPPTPEHPGAMNPQLEIRLGLLLFLDDALKGQKTPPRSDWRAAMNWGHEWLLKGARKSIEEHGPMTGHAQEAALKRFVESLGASNPKEAA